MPELSKMDNKEILITEYIEQSIQTKKVLLQGNKATIIRIVEAITDAYHHNHKVIWFGNGGSAADAQHLACELVSRFYFDRKALASISLTTNTSELTAIANDYSFNQVFARQVEALVNKGDVVIGISTSGNSPNVVEGIRKAKQLGAITVAFTGSTGGALTREVDYLVNVPSDTTPHIQESHIMVGHIICYLVEKEMFQEA